MRRDGRGPGWAAVALGAAAGLLAGVVLAVVLAGNVVEPGAQTVTRTIIGPVTNGGTVIVKTVVPPLVGEGLDTAKDRLKRSGFASHIDAGGGLFGPIDDGNWEVVAQRPAPGRFLERGSTVHLDIRRR